jgi:hypothetical protein
MRMETRKAVWIHGFLIRNPFIFHLFYLNLSASPFSSISSPLKDTNGWGLEETVSCLSLNFFPAIVYVISLGMVWSELSANYFWVLLDFFIFSLYYSINFERCYYDSRMREEMELLSFCFFCYQKRNNCVLVLLAQLVPHNTRIIKNGTPEEFSCKI